METFEIHIRMRVIVTTYSKKQHLLENFDRLMKKHWGVKYEVDISPEGEHKSDQLIRIANLIEDDYFILLQEDFYLYEDVDKNFLKECKEFAEGFEVDRFSLQARKDGYEMTSVDFGEVAGRAVYQLMPTERYLCSLEASIWRRKFLLENLESGYSDRSIELEMSKRVKQGSRIFVPEEPVLVYTDAFRGGEPRMVEKDGYLEVTAGALEGLKIEL